MDKQCSDSNRKPGMKCCIYENLTSDEFVYKNVHSSFHQSYGTYITTNSLDIQQFIIANSEISSIPKNIFQHINKLKHLDVLNSGLKNICVSDFVGAKELTHLNLTKNAIETLEPKVFVYAESLLILDLSFNEIANLTEYAFDHLDMLKTLILSNNKLVAFDAKQKFANLEVFHINDNLLNAFGQEIFQNSLKLREIDLKNNPLSLEHLLLPSDVILDTFDISNNLASISINSKRICIRNTSTSSYSVHRNVEVLDASNNQISNIQFESNAHLTNINLSNNNLTSMENITHLNNLQQLDLSFNSIKDFAISSFSEMNDLHVLNLKKSGLTSLDFGTFSQQTKLTFLDVSDNNLKRINFDMLLFMSSLSVLHIDGNQLTSIDVSDIKNILPNLTTMSISRNLFQCNDLITVVKTLNSSGINLTIVDDNVVKSTSNIRGIKCFSNSYGGLIQNSSNTLQLPNNSDSHFDKQTNVEVNQQQLLDLKTSLESFKNQLEKRFDEQVQNLTSLNEKFNSFSETNHLIHGNESDSFQFAFSFLLIVLILLVFGFSIILYCKYRARRRWYMAAKQNSTSADQTLV